MIDEITIENEIGRGFSGSVYKVDYKGKKYALKIQKNISRRLQKHQCSDLV